MRYLRVAVGLFNWIISSPADSDWVFLPPSPAKMPVVTAVIFGALTDVHSPLLGADGAARSFAPQKGATAVEVEILERNLAHWAMVAERDLGRVVADVPGAGAAGGMGAGCVAFLGATLMPGAEWVAEQSGLREAVSKADLVLTGEGRIDRQTFFGKAPAYVAQLARALGKPVVALGGECRGRA